MLIEPNLSKEAVFRVLKSFGLRNVQANFFPSGDVNSAVYRVRAEGLEYLLKLRRGDFDEIAATIPAYLRSRGLTRVMAPLRATAGGPWVHANGFDWMLYPWFAGKTGFQCPLSEPQWIALGATLRQVHRVILPTELARRVPRESYWPRYRSIVRGLDGHMLERGSLEDPIAAQFVAFWTSRRSDIRAVLERAEQLAQAMPERPGSLVLCHSDLHAGNVLVGNDGQVAIVDWDNPVFAHKERDLMFVGGGVGGAWNDSRESEWFFTGYGSTDVDATAIAFYRYERIVIDIAEYGQRILDPGGSTEDRQHSLRKLASGFEPHNVVEMAHRSFPNLR